MMIAIQFKRSKQSLTNFVFDEESSAANGVVAPEADRHDVAFRQQVERLENLLTNTSKQVLSGISFNVAVVNLKKLDVFVK